MHVKSWGYVAAALGLALAGGSAQAQTAEPAAASAAPATAEPPAAPATIRIPAMTLVDLDFVQPLSSATAKIDDFFDFRLRFPIVIGGREIVPAGTPGKGQIVHSQKAGWGGRAGELIVAARYLDLDGFHIPLRRFRMGESQPGTGDSRVEEAFGASMVVPLAGFFVNGGNKEVLAGTHANAIVAVDTDLPVPAAPAALKPDPNPTPSN